MAGEKKGKAYEALMKLALERLRDTGVFKGQIFWDQKPKKMSIVPDLTIGKNIDTPELSVMISHGGSAKESNRKYWRNCGELCEYKLLLDSPVVVLSVFFDAVIKPEIKQLGQATFDGELIVGDRPYGPALQAWIEKLIQRLPAEKEQKVESLRTLRKANLQFSKLCASLERDLQELILRKPQKSLEWIWSSERSRVRGSARSPKQTCVRRGLSKLLIFEDIDLALRLYSGQRVALNQLPSYVFDLKLANKAIGRATPGDSEIQNTVELLGVDTVKSLIQQAPRAEMSAWLKTLRNLPHLTFMAEYVCREREALCRSSELAKRLYALHDDPIALTDGCRVPLNWPPESVWLLEILLETFKEVGGSATSYGYSQLAREASALTGMPPAGDRVYRIVLPDWILRRGVENLEKHVLCGISEVLSARLSDIDSARLKHAVAKALENVRTNIFETKVCTYRGFDPLYLLLVDRIPGFKLIKEYPCFAQAAGVSGQGGLMEIGLAGNMLIHWQSCSDAGRDHKKKELCGRAVSLRYSWDAVRRQFVNRQGVKKLALVLDGTWRQEDLQALTTAGWDFIFYPDEVNKLASLVRG